MFSFVFHKGKRMEGGIFTYCLFQLSAPSGAFLAICGLEFFYNPCVRVTTGKEKLSLLWTFGSNNSQTASFMTILKCYIDQTEFFPERLFFYRFMKYIQFSNDNNNSSKKIIVNPNFNNRVLFSSFSFPCVWS